MSGKRLLQKQPTPSSPSQLVITKTDTKTGTSATSHSLTGVAANSLLVLTTGMSLGGGIVPTISSNPSLTWTKRVDSDGSSGSAEIYTALFTAGGNITVTSNWGSGRFQSSVLYAVSNAENPPAGAIGSAVQQIAASVNITTTRTNSILFAITSDWNAETGTITYRGTPTQTHYSFSAPDAAIYHYYYNAPTQTAYNVGLTQPAIFDGKGTAVIEIRRTNSGGSADTTPPSAFTVSSPSHTSTTIDVTWTASTDNVAVVGYDVYLNGLLQTTVSGLSHSFSLLNPSTTYNIQIRAKDLAGNTTASNTVVVTTDAPPGDSTPPSAPVLTSPSNSSTTIGLSWTLSTDNVGVTGYEIYVNNVLNTTVSLLSHTLIGLTPNTTYTIRVRAKDAAGNGTNSNNVIVTTQPTSGGGPLVPFTMAEIPYSDPDLITYGRGAEQWHYPCTNSAGCRSNPAGWDRISNPTVASNSQWVENSKNAYHRFQWYQLEGPGQGQYNIVNGVFGNALRDAINKGQMFSFGIMTLYGDSVQAPVLDGGRASIPSYLHTAMQALPAGQRDTLISGFWVPNWNSSVYLTRLRALHVEINNWLMTGTHTYPIGHAKQGQTVNLRDAIYCIDIRGFGDFGEWHSGGFFPFGSYSGSVYNTTTPSNVEPSIATLKTIIDHHTQVFQNWPLVMMVAAYNGTGGAPYINIFHPHNEVGHYALKATNAWGKVGYRRDQVVGTDNYLIDLLSENNSVYNGETFSTLFLGLGNSAPGTGEPLPGAFDSPDHDKSALESTIALYKHTSFGNGNFGGALGYRTAADNTSATANFIRAGFKKCGFRLRITTGQAPQTITRNTPFNIQTNWVNVGVAPTYENWDVVFELKNTSTNAVVWSGVSTKVLKLFLPEQGTVLTTDTFSVSNSVAAGTYRLTVAVKDPTGYKWEPLSLAIQGRNSDGSYTIFNNVTVS